MSGRSGTWDRLWQTDPERARLYVRRARLKKYGMTPEDYDEMLALQEGVCAICQRGPGARSLHVDHDHTTGEVRGLLCHGCNTAIGLLGEQKWILRNALDYLSRFEYRRRKVNA